MLNIFCFGFHEIRRKEIGADLTIVNVGLIAVELLSMVLLLFLIQRLSGIVFMNTMERYKDFDHF